MPIWLKSAGHPVLAGAVPAMRSGFHRFFFLIFLALGPFGVWGATYHVANTGSDLNDGRSEQQAWRSLKHVNRQTFAPGDVILLQRGGVWRETLVPPSDGLTLDACGAGALPVISAAETVTGWVSLDSGDGAERWRAPFAAVPIQLFLDGVRMERMASAAAVQTPGQWHWDTVGHITLATASGPPASVEVSVRDSGIVLEGRSDMRIRNLRVEAAGRDGIAARTLDRSTIEDCEIHNSYVTGIQLGGHQLRRDVFVRRNTITETGGGGIGFGGRLQNFIIEENTITGAGRLTQHIVGCGDKREASFAWTGGIKIWGWAEPGWQGFYTIRNNVVRDAQPLAWAPEPAVTHGHGIWADEVLRPTARPQIHGNRVFDCHATGVYLEKTDDHDAYDNLVVRCARIRYTAAIQLQSNQYGYDWQSDRPDDKLPRKISGNRIFNNTAIGGWWTFSASASAAACTISNNEIRDNIFVRLRGKKIESGHLYLHGGGANNGTNGDGNTYRNNSFGPEALPTSWVWAATKFEDLAALEAASAGAITGSIPGTPVFVDLEGGDYHLAPGSPGRDAATDGGEIGFREHLRPLVE